MSDQTRKRRTRGWRAVEQVRRRGDETFSAMLEGALVREGRQDRLTHGFHTYPAGLHPDAAKDLLSVVDGESLLDPFSGGGTTLVEGMVAGRRVVGSDLSPIACLVSKTRCRLASPEGITAIRSAARKITVRARESDEPTPRPQVVADWYDPGTLRELLLIRRGIEELEDKAVAEPLWCVLSSILIKTSFRESDTSMNRKVEHRPPGTTAVLFHKKARELGRRMEALAEAVPAGTAPAQVLRRDVRQLTLKQPVDGVITSPPYPGVYDYLPLQTLRVAWLGIDDADARRSEIAARRNFRADRKKAVRRWREETTAWMQQVGKLLRPQGRMAIVIGDGLVGEKMVDAYEPTLESAVASGFVPVAAASGARREEGRDALRWEHVILLERVSKD